MLPGAWFYRSFNSYDHHQNQVSRFYATSAAHSYTIINANNMPVPIALRSKGPATSEQSTIHVDFLADTFQRLSIPVGGSPVSNPSTVRGSLPYWAQLDRTVSYTSLLSDASILHSAYKRFTLILLSPSSCSGHVFAFSLVVHARCRRELWAERNVQ